jgi:predicted phosphoribosyltransferase
MFFQNREEAAELIADRLVKYRGRNPLVLGIPRGAVPMAKVIAEALEGELDVVLVHKLGAPNNPEYAVGAVSEGGDIYLNESAKRWGISQEYILREAKAQIEVLRQRRALYTPIRPPVDPLNRIVIVVDNGIATGATMVAALRAVRAKHPAELIGAVAVAPKETIERISKEADAVVCLEIPEDFYAVGEYFRDFSQVTDKDVIESLQKASAKKSPAFFKVSQKEN